MSILNKKKDFFKIFEEIIKQPKCYFLIISIN